MKINVHHLVDLLEYLHKEHVTTLEVSTGTHGMALDFLFFDSENRECVVKLYSAQGNSAPELTKTMKLYTRLGENEKVDHIKDALEYKAKKDKDKK